MRHLLLVVALSGASAACDTPASLKLDLPDGSLALYGTHFAHLPVVAISTASDTLPMRRLTVSPANPSLVEVQRDSLRCVREGSTRIELGYGELREAFNVECHFPRAIQRTFLSRLELRAPAPRYQVLAEFADGTTRALPVHSIRVDDSTVVDIDSGRVLPRRVGRTTLYVDVGGRQIIEHVNVYETIVSDTVSLDAAESRGWPLAAGRYTVHAARLDRDAVQWLRVETEGARCVPDALDDETVHCVLAEAGGIGLRHRREPGAGTRRVAFEVVRRP